jgi:pimeloyl-ACP methyl ester carboxylesterase
MINDDPAGRAWYSAYSVRAMRHRSLTANGIRLHVVEQGDGNPVVLLHGFPELWFSWRRQLGPLAEAGYRAIAPDLRGYGDSDAPPGPEGYDVVTLADDVAGLMDALELDTAAIVGHDWGANLAWCFALIHSERVACVAGIGVPYIPRAPARPTAIMREQLGEDFYVVWFQEPGPADEALARDVRRTILTPAVWDPAWAADLDDRPRRPSWLSEEEVKVYVDTFERTGFTGGLNWYRNIDRNWELLADYEGRRITQPALFMAGSRDSTMKWVPPEVMQGHVTDLRDTVIVEGAGHWLQQERPAEVNERLIRFLAETSW